MQSWRKDFAAQTYSYCLPWRKAWHARPSKRWPAGCRRSSLQILGQMIGLFLERTAASCPFAIRTPSRKLFWVGLIGFVLIDGRTISSVVKPFPTLAFEKTLLDSSLR